MMITIYGIKNCNTMKKAFDWLDQHKIAYHFHNYKTDNLTDENLQQLIDLLGYDAIINKKGTTWRKLPDDVRQNVTGANQTKAVIQTNLSMIKRPIIIKEGKAIAGFDPESYQQFFNIKS